MTKLEQVINGLLIHMRPSVCVQDDIVCPYFHDADCYKNLMADAVELLKEQEPRVLTLEEVPDAVFCYLEYKAYGTIEPAIFGEVDTDDTVAFTTLEDGKDYLDISDYCKAWRCWTAMPTDEQREVAKWDD